MHVVLAASLATAILLVITIVVFNERTKTYNPVTRDKLKNWGIAFAVMTCVMFAFIFLGLHQHNYITRRSGYTSL